MSLQDSSEHCYRHPERDAGVHCQRCDKLICPSCMNSASVGFHCPDCTKSGAQKVYRASDLVVQPYVTFVLIALNVLAFVVGIGMGDNVQSRRFGSDGLTQDFGLTGIFIDLGGEWYRIFTSGFLHGGILHLGMNMYALYLLGKGLERGLGPVRFVLAYFVALVAGSFGALLFDPNVFTVGASGAIYGMFGVMLANHMAAGRSIMQSGLGPILALNVVFTLGVPGISLGGHLGGFIGGYLCGLILFNLPGKVKLPPYAVEALMALAGVVFFLLALWAAGTWMDPLINI